MAATVIKMVGNSKNSIRDVAAALQRKIEYEKIADIRRESQSMQMILLGFEKYFMRNGGYTSVQILLMQTPEGQTADIVGSGGGTGVFNISWGSNRSFAEEVEDILKESGFSTISQ